MPLHPVVTSNFIFEPPTCLTCPCTQVANDSVARKLRVSKGALLQNITPGGAAAQAGLLPTRRGLGGIVPGDVVVGLAGKAVNNAGDLESVLDGCGAGVGDRVWLDVVRMGDQVGRGSGCGSQV